MCKSAKKTFEELGVEVYEIGARQCRELFGWRGICSCVDWQRQLLNRALCDTMRKGAYLVAIGFATFGYQSQSIDLFGDGTVQFAMLEVLFHQNYDRRMTESGRCVERPYQHHIEVWHLVDDEELWGDWERRVLVSWLTSTDEPACGDGHDECDDSDAGAEDSVAPVVTYESRISGSAVEYLCGVWVAEVGCYVTVSYSYPNFEVSCVDDWHGNQPMTFDECDAYGWMPWPYDAILEVDLPCENVDWEIVDSDGDEYYCMDLEDVRVTLGRYHMIPLFSEYVGMYGDPATPPEIYSSVAVVKVRACCL